jgi:hypothetical protein
MRRFGITAAAGIFAALLAGQAYAAAPTCNNTTILASGGTTNLAGLSNGNCAQVGDKIFGDASVGGALTGQTGSAQFTINVSENSTTVNFQGSVSGLASGNINYSVAEPPKDRLHRKVSPRGRSLGAGRHCRSSPGAEPG